jgi:hypothetical protein
VHQQPGHTTRSSTTTSDASGMASTSSLSRSLRPRRPSHRPSRARPLRSGVDRCSRARLTPNRLHLLGSGTGKARAAGHRDAPLRPGMADRCDGGHREPRSRSGHPRSSGEARSDRRGQGLPPHRKGLSSNASAALHGRSHPHRLARLGRPSARVRASRVPGGEDLPEPGSAATCGLEERRLSWWFVHEDGRVERWLDFTEPEAIGER